MILTGLLVLSSGFLLITLASISPVSQRMRGLFYGWKLVGISALVMALVSGPIWNGVGVWVKALELQFGWSRTQLTGAFSLTQLEGSILGPLMGYFIDRLGPQRMVFVGLILTGLGFIVFSRTTTLVTFYFAYILIMAGTMAGSWLPMMAVINRWFNRKRGIAMAITGEGEFAGGLLLVPALAWAVNPAHLGWSATALWIGVVFLAVAWPISRLIRFRPEDYGQLPDGDPNPNQQEGSTETGNSLQRDTLKKNQPEFTARQAVRTKAFWFITFGHAFSAMLFATLTVHLIPLLTDQGLSLQTAAYMFSMMMIVGAVFNLIGGYVGDRIPINVAIFVFGTLQAAGFVLAAFVNNVPMALLFALIFGAGFGGRMPLAAAIRGEYFGKRAFATLTGISMAPMSVFMLAAPLFAASMFDTQGNYILAFLILGTLGSMNGVLYLFAKKPEFVDPIRGSDAVPRPA